MTRQKKLRPYTTTELRKIRKNYAMAVLIDNKRLAEANMPYRYDSAGFRVYLKGDTC